MGVDLSSNGVFELCHRHAHLFIDSVVDELCKVLLLTVSELLFVEGPDGVLGGGIIKSVKMTGVDGVPVSNHGDAFVDLVGMT